MIQPDASSKNNEEKLSITTKKKKKLITEKEAIDLLLKSIFTKPSTSNRKNRK